MPRIVCVLVAVFLCATPGFAGDWGALEFLIGRWTGEGGGQPGNGSGAFTFSEDLQHKVLVRRSFAEYPAQNGKPAFRHDDLMVVYRDAQRIRAIYFDNEDHTIQYAVETRGDAVVFVSEGGKDAVRYRMTYTPSGKDQAKMKFEIAPPGKDFTAYIDAKLKKDPAARN